MPIRKNGWQCKKGESKVRKIQDRINWAGILGAVLLAGYGIWEEPMAMVLAGIILLSDIAVALTGIL